jgi:transcriptional regulator with XRE-family HTH domain
MPSNPHAIRVGRNVRAEIARGGFSQTTFAERLKDKQPKITQQKLSRCISGQQTFRVDELHLIAEELDVSVSELIGEEKASA